MILLPVVNQSWDNLSLAQGLMDDLKQGTPGTPAVMSAKGELPTTYLFQTREKSIGILQILELQKGTRPRYIKIQYKLLEYGLNEISVEKKLEAERLGTEGWQLWKNQEFTEAEKKFKEAVEIDPSLDAAWNGLGWAQLNQGKPQAAKQAFEKCIQLKPKHPAALNGLGWIAKNEGKIDEAIKYWQDAVNETPGATAALNGLATTYMEQKEYEKAIEIYEKWLKVEPKNREARLSLEVAENLLLISSEISNIQEQQKSTSLSSPQSESDLAKERDRAITQGELVKACDWEMKRVLLRKETGHAYKDKIGLEKLYEDLIRGKELSTEKKQALFKETQEYLNQHQGEEEYEWRLYSLLSTMAQDMGQIEEAAQYLDQAMASYPFVGYAYPSKFSKYHHLVNKRAGIIWDYTGVEAAEKYFLDHLANDKKCEYFHEYWWKNKYEESNLEPRHDQMLKKVKEAYQIRVKKFPERKALIEKYLSALDEAIKMREKSR